VAGTQLVPFFGVGVHYSATGDSFAGMTEPGYYATVGMQNQYVWTNRFQLIHGRILLLVSNNGDGDIHHLRVEDKSSIRLRALHSDIRLCMRNGSFLESGTRECPGRYETDHCKSHVSSPDLSSGMIAADKKIVRRRQEHSRSHLP
jgi:hypothetical protein